MSGRRPSVTAGVGNIKVADFRTSTFGQSANPRIRDSDSTERGCLLDRGIIYSFEDHALFGGELIPLRGSTSLYLAKTPIPG